MNPNFENSEKWETKLYLILSVTGYIPGHKMKVIFLIHSIKFCTIKIGDRRMMNKFETSLREEEKGIRIKNN